MDILRRLTARPMRPKSPTASDMMEGVEQRGRRGQSDADGGVSLRRPGARGTEQKGVGWGM